MHGYHHQNMTHPVPRGLEGPSAAEVKFWLVVPLIGGALGAAFVAGSMAVYPKSPVVAGAVIGGAGLSLLFVGLNNSV